MTINARIADLKIEYSNQVTKNKDLIRSFDGIKPLQSTQSRRNFSILAIYVDKLNFYETNLNKLEALEKLVIADVLSPSQNNKLLTFLGSKEFEQASLWEIIKAVNLVY